jgi:hypothetical protein
MLSDSCLILIRLNFRWEMDISAAVALTFAKGVVFQVAVYEQIKFKKNKSILHIHFITHFTSAGMSYVEWPLKRNRTFYLHLAYVLSPVLSESDKIWATIC